MCVFFQIVNCWTKPNFYEHCRKRTTEDVAGPSQPKKKKVQKNSGPKKKKTPVKKKLLKAAADPPPAVVSSLRQLVFNDQ
jgi:hypothetical protein